MAETTSKIKLIFEGAERGVAAAAAKSSAAIKRLTDDNDRLSKSSDKAGSALLGIGKGLVGIGAAGSAVQTVGGVAGALAQLAPAALVLPGALLGGAAAMTTFKIATAGFGDAIGAGLSGDMAKFAEATKDMDPAMRSAAKAVVAFKPQIDELKKTVQGNFWQGFAEGVTEVGKNLLPTISDGLEGIAGSLNEVVLGALDVMKTRFFQEDVGQILDNTTEAVSNMSPALGKALSGFVSLGAVGSTYLPRLGKAIDSVASKFKAWVDKGVEDGSIKRMIDGAVAGLQSLGRIAKNIGSSIGSVFRGLGTDFGSPLAKIEELTGKVAAFLKTAQGQDALRALGETLRVVSDQVGRVLDAGMRELGPTLVKLAPVAKEVARTLGDLLVAAIETLGPIIRGVADTFNEFPGSASAATVAVVGFVAAIKTIKAVNAVTDLLGIERAFGSVGKAAGGKAAEEAGKSAAGFWGKGFAGGLALVGVGVAGTIILDKVLPRDAAKTHGSQVARDMLAEMSKVLQGGGTAFQTLDVARWISNPIAMAVEVGSRELQKLFGIKPPPVPVHVDTQPASAAFNAWNDHVGDSIATANLDADPTRAMGTVSGWVGGVSRTRGTASLDADASRGNNVLGGWKGRANATVGTARLDANTASANGSVSAFVSRWNGYTIRMNAVVSSRIGGLAGGGPVVGPGGGTSDTAGLFALSNGEYVATARQVDAAGGPSGFGRLMAMLERGQVRHFAGGGDVTPMRASARAAMRTPAASSGSSGGGTVVQFAGNTSDALATVIMGMIRQGKIQIKAA